MIAHELAHIKNHDTLIMTDHRDHRRRDLDAGAIRHVLRRQPRQQQRPLGIIGTLAMVILAPIAAMLVQMAISRTREYAADKLGAQICGEPSWLASALAKISNAAHADPERDRRAQSGDRAYVHHQPAVGRAAWTTCSRPIRRPRTGSRRCSRLRADGQDWARRRLRAVRPRGRAAAAACRRPAPGVGRRPARRPLGLSADGTLYSAVFPGSRRRVASRPPHFCRLYRQTSGQNQHCGNAGWPAPGVGDTLSSGRGRRHGGPADNSTRRGTLSSDGARFGRRAYQTVLVSDAPRAAAGRRARQ